MPPASGRRRILGVSTKMYFSAARTRAYVDSLVELLRGEGAITEQVDLFVIPDLVTLTGVIGQLAGTPQIWAGAQDCFSEDFGAFTGEVSPAVLAEVGARLVEIGHAERRRLFGETDASTAAKAAAVARHGMVPLVCIGEVERPASDAGAAGLRTAVDEVMVQVSAVLAAVPDGAEVVLAYEPVWAIGQAQPAGVDHVCAVVDGIRASESVSRRSGLTRILYGGSAGPGLFAKLSGSADGLFLGRFGHAPEAFVKTAREVTEA